MAGNGALSLLASVFIFSKLHKKEVDRNLMFGQYSFTSTEDALTGAESVASVPAEAEALSRSWVEG